MTEYIYNAWDYNDNFYPTEDNNNFLIYSSFIKIDKNKGNISNNFFQKKINCVIKINNQNIKIHTKDRDSTTGFFLFEIIFNKDKGKIENISKTNEFRGCDMLLLALQLLNRFNVKEVSLTDSSFIICDTRSIFFDKRKYYLNTKGIKIFENHNEFPLNIINLLRFQHTYYMPFGFYPYHKESNLIMTDNIKYLLQELYKITWIELDNYFKLLEHTNSLIKNNNIFYNFRIRDIKKWKKYVSTIINSWNEFKNKYLNISISPFQAFEHFTNENCHLFIDWLELYSIKYSNYYNIFNYDLIPLNSNKINNKINLPIPGKDNFNKLLNILNYDVKWLNKSLVNQPRYWKY
jgi:hypothetical protein